MGSAGGTNQLRKWWKESSVYQVYPATFQDSTGSGVGDLKGIISRVDYLKKLGVDIVWMSPIFESPQIDMGYDISDYEKIDPPYGHISDVDTLAEALHSRGMKMVLDLVVNHTSDKHHWFQESRKSKDNPYRDWYIWRPPRYDADGNRQPPTNWDAHFQGSTWEYDETTDEYYLHLFCKEQPDLNWENPKVRAEVHRIMRFWLDRGCDGFRIDVINFISKDQSFPDSQKPVHRGSEFYACGPRCHEYLQGIGKILKEYDAFSVGEMPCVHDERELIKAVRSDRDELSMIFHFELMDIDHGVEGKYSWNDWPLSKLKETVTKWQRFMYDNDGWNALYLENHDQPRAVSRFAHDSPELRQPSAKMIAIFMGFQAGTPFVYQGQEIGMTNVPVEWGMEDYQDVDCLSHWNLVKDKVDEETKNRYRWNYQKKSRDNARTPMQWDGSANAGFSTGKPWMRVNDNYKSINAAAQVEDPNSVFHCWSQVLGKRKEFKEVFVYGDYDLVDEKHEKVFAYKRVAADGKTAIVACNFSDGEVVWESPLKVGEVLIGTGKGDMVKDGKITLGACEAIAFFV